MSKQAATDWIGTGEEAADQRLEPVYWRTRVFRNSYVRAGKLHRVRGWSAKIQYQGVRRTVSLGAVDQDVAAAKAASLFANIQQHGWLALGQREGSTQPSVATVPGEADPRESVDYWRLRLVQRKYRATPDAKPELSCRIEHDGVGCYFPLGTLKRGACGGGVVEHLQQCRWGRLGGCGCAASTRTDAGPVLVWQPVLLHVHDDSHPPRRGQAPG